MDLHGHMDLHGRNLLKEIDFSPEAAPAPAGPARTAHRPAGPADGWPASTSR
jgi:hypothetical protein